MENPMIKKGKTNLDEVDYFEQLPDEVLLHIIDSISKSSDINTLFRLRTLSCRFNSLVINKTEHLVLQADKFDRIFGMEMVYDAMYPIVSTDFLIRKAILRSFNHVTKLVIEYPPLNVDYWCCGLKHEVKCMCKGTFGKNLKNGCVILCHAPECYCQSVSDSCPVSLAITKILHMNPLIPKCAFIAMNLVPHLENLVSLVLKDSKGDLELVMDNEEEIREGRDRDRVVNPVGWYGQRIMTSVNELGQSTIALVVMAGPYYKEVDDAVDADLINGAFGSEVHGMAIERLFHDPFYLRRFGPR